MKCIYRLFTYTVFRDNDNLWVRGIHSQQNSVWLYDEANPNPNRHPTLFATTLLHDSKMII
jgi:hypothetical protein